MWEESEKDPAPKRKRLLPHERERQIVDEAIRFFAEKGFDGQIRELADRVGVSNGLLFRYFPTKAALLDRVYAEVFEGRWKPDWDSALANKDSPLRERLITFYLDYARIVHSPQWVRTFLYAGLAGLDINRKYRQLLRKTIFLRVLSEVRIYHGLVPPTSGEFTPLENELIASLHAMVFHAGVRQWVYGYEALPAAEGIPLYIDMFLAGANSIYATKKRQHASSVAD